MLVKRSKTPTNYVLPVYIKGFRKNFYYECESYLFKAYRQLKKLNGPIRPSYPVIYESGENNEK